MSNQLVTLSIPWYGVRYLCNVVDETVDGQKCCNFAFTPALDEASVMSARDAARRLPLIRRALGHQGIVTRDAETGYAVGICFECRQAIPLADMLTDLDLCIDCCTDINDRIEASMPDLDGW